MTGRRGSGCCGAGGGTMEKKGNGPVPTVRCLGRPGCVFFSEGDDGGWGTRDFSFLSFSSSLLFSLYHHRQRHRTPTTDEHLLTLFGRVHKRDAFDFPPLPPANARTHIEPAHHSRRTEGEKNLLEMTHIFLFFLAFSLSLLSCRCTIIHCYSPQSAVVGSPSSSPPPQVYNT